MSELIIENLHVHYGTSHILQGVDMTVEEGAAVAYLGGNGAGKTTTFKSIMGLLEPTEGSISYRGIDLVEQPAYNRASLGISYIPSELEMFKMTVRENLKLAYTNSEVDFEEQLQRIYDIFPPVEEKMNANAESLSGGQKRMVAIARGLINEPDLLLMDEPTEGLAPEIRVEVVEALKEIRRQGMSILLIEHNLPVAYELCEKGYILRRGTIAYEGDIETIRENPGMISGIEQ